MSRRGILVNRNFISEEISEIFFSDGTYVRHEGERWFAENEENYAHGENGDAIYISSKLATSITGGIVNGPREKLEKAEKILGVKCYDPVEEEGVNVNSVHIPGSVILVHLNDGTMVKKRDENWIATKGGSTAMGPSGGNMFVGSNISVGDAMRSVFS